MFYYIRITIFSYWYTYTYTYTCSTYIQVGINGERVIKSNCVKVDQGNIKISSIVILCMYIEANDGNKISYNIFAIFNVI